MLDVELGVDFFGELSASYDLGLIGPKAKIVVEGYEDDTFESVARQMVRVLALLGFRGDVRLVPDEILSDEEERKEIAATARDLAGELTSTDEYARRVREEVARQAEGEV